jgi:hypothetical protein
LAIANGCSRIVRKWNTCGASSLDRLKRFRSRISASRIVGRARTSITTDRAATVERFCWVPRERRSVTALPRTWSRIVVGVQHVFWIQRTRDLDAAMLSPMLAVTKWFAWAARSRATVVAATSDERECGMLVIPPDKVPETATRIVRTLENTTGIRLGECVVVRFNLCNLSDAPLMITALKLTSASGLAFTSSVTPVTLSQGEHFPLMIESCGPVLERAEVFVTSGTDDGRWEPAQTLPQP